jgi:hypothetical protein
MVLDQTTQIRAASCKAGFTGGTSQSRTYTFNQYTRAIGATATTMLGGTVPFTTGYPAGGDGKFLDAENSIGTSDGAYGFWFSFTSASGLRSNNNTMWWGVKGLDIGVDNTGHVTTVYFDDPTADGSVSYFGTPTNTRTTTPDPTSNSATTLPVPVHFALVCTNSATQNVVNCVERERNAANTAWVNTGVFSPTFSRDTNLGQLLVNDFFNDGFALNLRRLVTFGAINVTGTNVVGFPGPGIYTNWLDIEVESYRVPADPTFHH